MKTETVHSLDVEENSKSGLSVHKNCCQTFHISSVKKVNSEWCGQGSHVHLYISNCSLLPVVGFANFWSMQKQTVLSF